MWGDLWIFPFDVTIWGTVASWFSAIISSLSIFAAAAYYIIDKWQAAKSQARHVRFVRCYWTKFAVKAEVHNHSDESIFDVTVPCGRRPFRDYINRLMDSRPVEMDELPGLLEAWQALPGGNVQVRSFQDSHIRPGEFISVYYAGARSLGLVYWIEFRDSMARPWRMQLDQHEPIRIREHWRPKYTLTEVLKYRGARKYREERKRVQTWITQNAHK